VSIDSTQALQTKLRRLAGWFVVGVSGAVVELAVLRTLYEVVGWPLPVATAVAAEALILAKFLVTDRWVFRHARPGVDRLLKYHAACAGAFVVYWVVINGLAEFAGVPYIAAFVAGTAASFAWSLATNFLWVWVSR
jgi:putative flippase GtrA